MVDEYQDTNRPQYLLIQRLTSAHRNLCVVGDPDQSIYKWRGADLRNILDFEHDFPEATVVKLERNYRSTQVILDAASAVIAQNRNRKDKRLYTEAAGAPKIQNYRAADDLDEAEFIARTCRQALREDAENLAAVLYRTNAQSRTMEDGLRRAEIAYRIIGGVRFYERKEIKDTLCLPAPVAQPARRRQPAARDQRTGARHRQGRDGRHSRRSNEESPTSPAPLLAGLQRVGDRPRCGRSWNGRWTTAGGPPGRDGTRRLPQPRGGADGDWRRDSVAITSARCSTAPAT